MVSAMPVPSSSKAGMTAEPVVVVHTRSDQRGPLRMPAAWEYHELRTAYGTRKGRQVADRAFCSQVVKLHGLAQRPYYRNAASYN